jgi:alpha-glucuronidase
MWRLWTIKRSLAWILVFGAAAARAEDGHDAWLRYAPIDTPQVRLSYAALPAVVVTFGGSEVTGAARDELIRGVRSMLGRTLRIESALPGEGAIVLGTRDAIRAGAPSIPPPSAIAEDGYSLRAVMVGGRRHIVIAGSNDRGVLYGTFALLRKMGLHQPLFPLNETEAPYAPVRWVNQWDNLNGTIERGYGGPSIFFENDNVRQNLDDVRDYARLLASLGINGCAINNVNANTRVITTEFLPQLARVVAVFRPWGVRLAISLDFSSPKTAGGLDTFDPLDPRVVAWWQNKVDEIYRAVPDLGGFVLKADSEGRLGPSAYHRTHADAANVIARPLKRHGGLIFYRGFVYDHHMDWRNLKNDRARAAYDNFVSLDGKFEDNVVLQIKHGPIDFQVREPASPLFGALEKTNQAVELQITQEYFGQARHLVFLVPMWKEALDFDMHAAPQPTPVKALVAGKTFHRPTGGFVGVANVGRDDNWMGHDLSQANLYGYGRLAWNPNLSSRQIAEEWVRLTFRNDPQVVATLSAMLLKSWRAYENYTGPLGLQTLTEITGNHYGPAVEASERNGWGQWHRADEEGVGMDRTVATGTGYIGQYRPAVAKMYESLQECPDDLLVFMHHVPYTHVLHDGKTVIQYIYDSHYEGAATAQDYVREWMSLKGRIDEQRYARILAKLEYQAGHAQVWRDAVCYWFRKTSGIPDAQGRVEHHPGRTEAEAMELDGYSVTDVKPWEAASGSKAVECRGEGRRCSASMKYGGKPGWFDVDVQYFDQNNGVSRFRLFVGDQVVSQWAADDTIPTHQINAHSSTRRRARGIALRPGDVIRIEGVPDRGEPAALDYVEIHAASKD